MLYSDWSGPDAMEFGGKWEAVDSGDSVSAKFRESLKSYSETLTACAAAYQSAQETVYNKAAKLWK